MQNFVDRYVLSPRIDISYDVSVLQTTDTEKNAPSGCWHVTHCPLLLKHPKSLLAAVLMVQL